jgi:hypothetical protein
LGNVLGSDGLHAHRHAVGVSGLRELQLRLAEPHANLRLGLHLGRLGLVGNLLGADRVHSDYHVIGFSKLRQLQFWKPEPHADVLLELHMGLVGIMGDVYGTRLHAGLLRLR